MNPTEAECLRALADALKNLEAASLWPDAGSGARVPELNVDLTTGSACTGYKELRSAITRAANLCRESLYNGALDLLREDVARCRAQLAECQKEEK